MAESYARTAALLDEEKTEAASEVFARDFAGTVRNLFAEASSTYPLRFVAVRDWCDWTNNLYWLTEETQEHLEQGHGQAASESLDALADHFYVLHEAANTRTASHFIYAFHRELNKDAPSREQLAVFHAGLRAADPPIGTVRGSFEKASASWTKRAAKALRKKELKGWRLRRLRKKTIPVYEAFGLPFQ